jgi:hypothetical protein
MKLYCVTVQSVDPVPMDDGLTVNILMPANDPAHARRRVHRYYAGRIQAVRKIAEGSMFASLFP